MFMYVTCVYKMIYICSVEHKTTERCMENKNVFGMRLLAARTQAGLSQDALVRLLNGQISKTAIARYERGEMEPGLINAKLLAEALKQSMDYFYRPFTMSITSIDFRKNASLSIKSKKMITEKIAAFTERYLILENLLDFQTTFENPLKNNKVRNMEDIELLAEELHEAWELGFNPLGPIMCMLEDKGIKILELDTEEKFQGSLVTVQGNIPFIVIRKADTVERRRLTALHEVGHLLLDFDESFTETEVERLCNIFASAVLLPRRTFKREIGLVRSDFSKRELSIIKDRYGISAGAFVMRAYNMGVINKFRMIKLINITRQTKLEDHLGSHQLKDHPDRFDQLISIALSEGRISLTKAAELAQLDLETLMLNFVNNEETFTN